MNTTQLPEETIEGVVFQFQVNTHTGEFMVHFESEWWKADSLKKLREKLRTHLRQRGVAIPATLIDGEGEERLKITRITITGQHAGNDNWLYTENKSKERSQWRWGRIYRGLTGPEIQELVRLYREAKAAREKLEAHLEGLELDVSEAYEAARAAQKESA